MVRDIKESLVSVSETILDAKAGDSIPRKSYELPDGRVLIVAYHATIFVPRVCATKCHPKHHWQRIFGHGCHERALAFFLSQTLEVGAERFAVGERLFTAAPDDEVGRGRAASWIAVFVSG